MDFVNVQKLIYSESEENIKLGISKMKLLLETEIDTDEILYNIAVGYYRLRDEDGFHDTVLRLTKSDPRIASLKAKFQKMKKGGGFGNVILRSAVLSFLVVASLIVRNKSAN